MQRFILSNDRLTVKIQAPGSAYKNARFDWTSFITEVILDAKHTFCAPESLVPGVGTFGNGLCGAFGADTSLGYDTAKPGEYFARLGVGLIKRIDEKPYSAFNMDYEIEPFETDFQSFGTRVVFQQHPKECQGYAARFLKEISIEDNKLFIKSVLENKGDKTIDIDEFNHNFVNINRQPLGSNYILELPYTPDCDIQRGENVITDKNTISWKDNTGEFFGVFNNFNANNTNSHYWELTEKTTGAKIKEISNFPVYAFNIWGKEHVVSPEIFIKIHVAPGESFEWIREYEFSANN
jgi:hypothetical protein